MHLIFLSSLFLALCSWLCLQAVNHKKTLRDNKRILQLLNELKPKRIRRASSRQLWIVRGKRSFYKKQQIAKQFISTILDEYEQLSEKVYQRNPGADGMIEDRDLLFP